MSPAPHPAGYRERLDLAFTVAGTGDAGWNGRFRVALALNGLQLGPAERHNTYPDGQSYAAPHPFPGDNGWPDDTYVIWA